MTVDELFEKYAVRRAIATEGYMNWVCSVAQPFNLTKAEDRELAADLGKILAQAKTTYGWEAVSSNNVFCEGIGTPRRIIYLPDPEGNGYLAIANPRVTEYGGVRFESHEGCGSFPGEIYIVERHSYITLAGTRLRDETDGMQLNDISLKYGLGPEDFTMQCKSESTKALLRITRASYSQHECDHLDSIVLPDIALSSYANLLD